VGTGFSNTPTLTIGGVSATGITYHGPTLISGTTPSGTVGAQDVVADGATLTDGFTYWSPSQNLTITDANAVFPTDRSLHGTPVFLVDETNKMIWMGIIASNTATAFTVSEWKSLFNADTVRSPSGTVSYHVGYLFLYDKTPVFSFLVDQYEKVLKRYEILTNRLLCPINVLHKLSINHGGSTTSLLHSVSDDRVQATTLSGLHRVLQLEHGVVAAQEFNIKEYMFDVEWASGRKDQ
jgi:hypothetical protein